MCSPSVSLSVSLSVRLTVSLILLLFFFGNVGSLTLTAGNVPYRTYLPVRQYRYLRTYVRQFTDGGSIPPAAYFFFAFVPDTGTEDFVCESDVGDGGRPTGRRAGFTLIDCSPI